MTSTTSGVELRQPIILIGYMCSGKTTLGRALAHRIDTEFVDLDEEIELAAGRTISDIFATDGEAAFRALESATLARLLNGRDAQPHIIAVGGGTPCFGDNMDLMLQHGITVKLEAPVERLLERLLLGAAQRPLVAGKSEPEIRQVIIDGLAKREPHYNRATYRFDASRLENQTQINESVTRFIRELNL